MRTPTPYTAKDGEVTWRVKYRTTTGRTSSQTFSDEETAQWFAANFDARGVSFALRMLSELVAQGQGDDESPSLSAVFAEYIEWKADRVRSERTIADYRRQYAESIEPHLGDRPVASITSAHVSTWVDDMVAGRITSPRTRKRLSPKTIAGRHSLLHSTMAYAADPRRAHIAANPCAGVDLPKRIKPTPKGLMPAEWQAIHAALATVHPGAADLAAFLIGSGFRWGEASALTPAAVEDYGTSMWVTMMMVRRRGSSGTVSVVPEGKAQKSMRRIKLDPATAAIVRAHLVGVKPNAPIFQVDGDPWTYNMFAKRFARAVEAANLSRRPTPHWLRHTHVAWLAMSGTPLPELQARIGHASITTTIGVYGSMIGDVQESSLTAFAAMRDGAPAVAPTTTPMPIESRT